MTTGYSGTPLARKLSLKPGLRAWWEDMPASVAAEIGDSGVIPLPAPEAPIDAAHIFVSDRATMAARIAALRPLLAPTGFLWVSWPKKASRVPTDITEGVIRAAVLPTTDLADVKVCAVDAVWSGLKLMIRKSAR
ncbi:MAG TPA: hypothetical protein DCG90_11690 [Sphingobium sp.]|uniref:hypothetical protein n=1 Tax=unclassified Sphingobium TaxID=2611147 RepID=UPI000EEA0CA4|nr:MULTISPECIES: hypothetical protein [unclassified Sphingobium]WIW87326.1 hypothetical protein K3M67_10040 [Sphingobium sp. V4]HAF42409.1 hypothetical protein [Sphingobium sp.]